MTNGLEQLGWPGANPLLGELGLQEREAPQDCDDAKAGPVAEAVDVPIVLKSNEVIQIHRDRPLTAVKPEGLFLG